MSKKVRVRKARMTGTKEHLPDDDPVPLVLDGDLRQEREAIELGASYHFLSHPHANILRV